ncbi:MAG: hypothetical protein WBX25_01795 [Rhodomicrobium sp.]
MQTNATQQDRSIAVSLVGLVAGIAAWLGLFLNAFTALPVLAADEAANVDGGRIAAADRDPGNWLTYGRTYSEQRFSPLSKITGDNVKELGLAWYADLDTNRGQEATPLLIDGVMFVSTAWSMVKAFDARTGALLWTYDPAVPRRLASGDAATWSIVASRPGRERSTSAPSMAGWSHWTRVMVSNSGA